MMFFCLFVFFTWWGGFFLLIVCCSEIVGWIEWSLIISCNGYSNLLIAFVYRLCIWGPFFSVCSMLKCSFKRDGAVSLCPFQDVDTSVGVSCTGQFVLIGRDEGIQILLPPLFANCFVTKIDARVNTFAEEEGKCGIPHRGLPKHAIRRLTLAPRERRWCGQCLGSYLKLDVRKCRPLMKWMA